MSYIFKTRLGEQLYHLLPEVYRTRDKRTGQTGSVAGTEDLAKYLDAHGHLLDLIHATLEQQLKDSLPESCQDWLLPYFSQLLAANIVSPEPEGRHAEIDHAISWRQRKGTLKCAEEIAQAVGRFEVEIQEGWKRVAVTPRIGMPIIPVEAWDKTLKINMHIPSIAAQHPGLPAVMVDFRRASRVVAAGVTNPAVRTSNFMGVKQNWRQSNFHGAPCFPGSFDDVSRRTVDIRTPNATKGRYHHKRLLAYAPPPAGIFPFKSLKLQWDKALAENIIGVKQESGVCVYSNNTDRTLIVYEKVLKNLDGSITLEPGTITLEADRNYRIENIHFRGVLFLASGQLELYQVEAKKVKVNGFSTDVPVLIAENCLFEELSVGAGVAQLDSCTVRGMAKLKDVDVHDCMLMQVPDPDPAMTGCIRRSRIPSIILSDSEETKIENLKDKNIKLTDLNNKDVEIEGLKIKDLKIKDIKIKELKIDDLIINDCTLNTPEFFNIDNALAAKSILAPNTSKSIYAGASDGAEMGYFHHGRKGQPVTIKGNLNLEIRGNEGYPLKDVIFTGSVVVTGGKLDLERAAVKSLTINTALADNKEAITPALNAIECLFDTLTVTDNLSRLEYCTVMLVTDCQYLQASDCIFVGAIKNIQDPRHYSDPPLFLNCIRYSAIPAGLDNEAARVLRIKDDSNRTRLGSNTMEPPVFTQFKYCHSTPAEQQIFAEPGYGVLNIVTSDKIRFGAEDGGEMGANHHKYYSLKWEAVLDKMREFLPVGIEPVLIQDVRLLQVPPEQQDELV